jgi:hypothetical protein
MLVSFLLKAPGSSIVAAPSLAFRQPLVAVEEINAGLSRQIGIPADARDPHEHVGRDQIKADP